MSTALNAYSPLTNFCVDTGAIHARIRLALDSTIFYTLSYTYTLENGNSLVPLRAYRSCYLTQNQVVETSCWFESGQGHQVLAISTI
jgi:hypothetical protein